MDENIKKFLGSVSEIVERLESLGWKELSFRYDAQSFGNISIKFSRGKDNLTIVKDRSHWELFNADRSQYVASNPELEDDISRQNDFVKNVLEGLAR
jgi:hypothetical protein